MDCVSPRKSALIDAELLRLNISIAALSETWLTGVGSVQENNYTLFWNGYPDGDRPMHGVGFAIQNKLLSSVEKPVPISSCLSSLRLHTNCGPVTIIATYAPTLTSDIYVKESFYNQLS